MITLADQPLFRERIEVLEPDRLRVTGALLAEPQKELFSYFAAIDAAALDYDGLAQGIADLAAARKARAAQARLALKGQWQGMCCLVGSPDQPREDRLALDEEIEESAEVQATLLALDKAGRLAIRSAQEWMKLAKEARSAGRPDDALLLMEVALRRLSFPYIKVRAKDDSALKLRAARATFRAGRHDQALEATADLVEARLKLVEEAWK